LALEGVGTEELKKYDLSEITNTHGLFDECELHICPDMNLTNVLDASEMFKNCTNLSKLPNLNLTNVTNVCFMYFGCSSLTEATIRDLNNVEFSDGVFQNCTNLKTSTVELKNTFSATSLFA